MQLKTQNFKKITDRLEGIYGSGDRTVFYIFLLLCLALVLAFIFPALAYRIPFGTDAFTHTFYSEEIEKTNSLDEFYKTVSEKALHPKREDNQYNYPFGLWMFGATVSKISGIAVYNLSYLLPIFFTIIILVCYYAYSAFFLGRGAGPLIAIAFLVSMPIILLELLEYRPSTFVIPLILMMLYTMVQEKVSFPKRLILLSILAFMTIISHSGTYTFILNFILLYLFLYAILWGKFDNNAYILLGLLLIQYTIVTELFPHIYYQYVTRTGGMIEDILQIIVAFKISALEESINSFYKEIFINRGASYAIILWILLGVFAEVAAKIRSNFKINISTKSSGFAAGIPILGNLKNISHSVMTTPFWLGPLQSILSIVGFFKINSKGKCLFLTVMLITIYPAMTSTSSTGALKYIPYAMIMLPITASAGLLHILRKIEANTKEQLRTAAAALVIFSFVGAVIITPVVGNTYYLPSIAIDDKEKTGLIWLGTVGTPDENVVGSRDRVSIFANKINIGGEIEYGNEFDTYAQYLLNVYFSGNGEPYVENLYKMFRVKYIVISERMAKDLRGQDGFIRERRKLEYQKTTEIQTDNNKQLDKIYTTSNTNTFDIYKVIPVKYAIAFNETNEEKIQFNETNARIVEDGPVFEIKTKNYIARIGKSTPQIAYLGDSTKNFFENGRMQEYLSLAWDIGKYSNDQSTVYFLDSLTYSDIRVNANQITYSTILQDRSKSENWADLTVSYTFYQDAMKREIRVTHDRIDINASMLRAGLTSRIVSDYLPHFLYTQRDGKVSSNTVFACNTTIDKEERFDSIYLSGEYSGMFMSYENTMPYPNKFEYSGLPRGNLTLIMEEISSEDEIIPGSYMLYTQYISLGEIEDAKRNIEKYKKVSMYQYPNGEHPLLLLSSITNLKRMSEVDFENSINAHAMIKEKGIDSYVEFISMFNGTYPYPVPDNYTTISQIDPIRINQLKTAGAKIQGGGDSELRFSDTFENQKKRLELMDKNAINYYGINIIGFKAPESGNINLAAVRALSEGGYAYETNAYIRPPKYTNYLEGTRYPKFANIEGRETDLLIIPISRPTDYAMTSEANEDVVNQWKKVIDAAIKADEPIVFEWYSGRIGNEKIIGLFTDTLDYAKEKGATFESPEKLTEHMRSMRNVSAMVTENEKGISIAVKNKNNEKVDGATIKIESVADEKGCSMKAENATLRLAQTIQECRYYISTDLLAGETKTIGLRY